MISKPRDRSHLTLLKPESTVEEMYGKVFEILADQDDTLRHSAWELFEEILEKGIDPADLKADGALLQLDIAQIPDGIDAVDGSYPVEYADSPQLRERARVRRALLGEDDDDDGE